MLMAVALVLAVLWLLGVISFHAVGGLVHILLIVALVALVLHFMRGRSTAL
jgi:hypothetical protein